ncbi:MAG: aminotransferase class I/II-fold pyridoxal phosphate-dependent enzyme [Akkermansiaceae bacterium]|nr:aminotransferase class I/II-fold pyridoxal phosphate-dependent enzyme [Armatimonadota bacterium]
MSFIPTSRKAARFGESVIREMTRLLLKWETDSGRAGVNLAQGFPDFAAPEILKEAACRAIQSDINQYAVTWGAPALRGAIADKTARFYCVRPDPEREITVTCGATEAMIAALLAVTDPGDEVIVFEPFYENYGPDAILSGATPVFVRLNAPDWSFDPEELVKVFNDRTRAIIINTPHNPSGKVFSRDELTVIAELCQRWNVCAITDEIYEHLVYDGAAHARIADLPGMAERTITISGLSKTYSATGWRIGWLLAPPDATNAIRKVHDFLTVGAAAPLQAGATFAINELPPSYYTDLANTYRQKRDVLLSALIDSPLRPICIPTGAYYILTDARPLMEAMGQESDTALARHLVSESGLATVPGSSFVTDPASAVPLLRFCYCKKPETLARAARLLDSLQRR